MYVFCWDFVEGLCAEIDGFNVCVTLELSDSVVCVHAKMCVVQQNCDSLSKLRFAAKVELSQQIAVEVELAAAKL
jgi:hypothetical protein